ncbi:hypothetical protein [Leeuwenhoekiella sp. H156]|uniref:hypothetical protein n=1 Tax=Leeuwenhoekiella sp. H156 TaxID=3450128 RepID=UPI003FA4675C
MRIVLRFFSYLMHPLLMPILGVVIYFYVTPKFVPESFMYAKLFALSILTIVVPVLFYFLLESVNVVSDKELALVKERRVPLLIQVAITLLILKLIINGYEFPELYLFFFGILIAAAFAFLCAVLRFKVSLHMIGVSGVLLFVMGLSMLYQSNFLLLIGFLVIAIGFTAASRLQSKAHTMPELLAGLVVGGLPQILLFVFYKM